ncbi:TFIIH complex serine/threonine-protein kinase subunit kin28 [Boothiomyces sp. JEL0838]|nr:TFIIH complex serine/threonine-protein kinase subunit kin28 [Boothiomyces sp. JEL0838]
MTLIYPASTFSDFKGYQKEKKIGEGTYATVYTGLALPRASDEQPVKVAIKKMKPGLFKDGLDMSGIREIKYLQELRHTNIILLHDVFCQKQALHLVLEFLDADLEMIIKNKGVVFSGADIKSWMMMLLRGDLKPNNLLLASDGTLKIADFGLARIFGDPRHGMTSQVVTLWYRSPELLLGSKLYGGAVDIWSVGCIFGELMLRTPYFASETEIGQLTTIMRARGTPKESDWPGMKQLPDYFEFTQYPGAPSRQIFTAASAGALELLDAMLLYDPLKRPTAEQALEYEYFKTYPRPTKPSKLPRDVGKNDNKRKAEDDGNKIAKRLFQ